MSFPFLKMFYEYTPEEPLRAVLGQAAVSHAEIDQESRRVRLTLELPCYVPARTLDEVAAALRSLYEMREMRLTPQYAPEHLVQLEGQELSREIIAAYSPAAGILAGCRWEIAAGETRLLLRANGKDQLAPYLPVAERYIRERFGVQTKIQVESAHELEGAALFEETERMRLEALRDMPAPVFAAQKKSAPAQVQTPQTLFGKPFRGEATPMREISLESDVGRVIVEGKVFAVNHKELKKSNAWVVNFDMTDYTGSIRVNRYMDAELAKPSLIL